MNHLTSKLDKEGIRKFFKIAAEYEDVLSLTIGEPDFSTPYHIREVAIQALHQGKTWYSPVEGFKALKDEVSAYLKRKFDLDYDSDREVLITVGASEALDLIFRSHVDVGDDVIVFQPAFVSYVPLAQLTGANIIIADTSIDDDFKITPELLKKVLTPNTSLIILSYPNNPTGATMTTQDYEALLPILKDYQGVIVSDEIYAELTYDHPHASPAMFEQLKEKVVLINGFSKAYAMTGWRLGYVCAPTHLLDPMITIHQYSLMCSPTISQFAAVEALKHGDQGILDMKEQYIQRQRYLITRLKDMGLHPFVPSGAFYVFVDVTSTGLSSEAFCQQLLKSKHVAVIPGNAFGDSGEGFIRISYSYALHHLKQALDRIEDFLTNR